MKYEIASDELKEKNETEAGKITLSETERRNEIDMRVGALLAKREAERYLYQRGFWDCLYLVVILAWVIYILWPELKKIKAGK